MTTIKRIPTVSPRIHPLMAGAAISVTALCIVATAAIAGWLPRSEATNVHRDADAARNGAHSLLASSAPDGAASGTPAASEAVNDNNERSPAPAAQPRAQRASQQRPAATHAAPRQPASAQVKQNEQINYVGIGAGAVIGGLLGNQVGKGSGRTLATIAGAVGGGMLGNEIQKQQR